MSARRIAAHVATAAALGAGGAAAVAPAMTVAPPQINSRGVDGVKVGATYKSLRAKQLIGKVRPGCELAGPKARGAALRSPLKGSVTLSFNSPRKVTDISVTGGPATARGVGIGAKTSDVTKAFPKAVIDHSGDKTFELTFVRVPKGGGGRLEFGVDTKTKRVTIIGIPRIPICD